MTDLSINLGSIKLVNPLVTASGTFGYGYEYQELIDFKRLGAITVKGVSPFPSHGNPMPRTAEVSSGMLNAIGLQNPGIDKFIADDHYLPFLRTLPCPVFVNIWGKTIADYAEVASRLETEKQGIAALEINISCPNVKEGGLSFGTDTQQAAKVVRAVREATSLPLITKLSPNVSNIADFARAVVDAGSDMISLINTLPGMAIDVETRSFKIANRTGGLSGPAIKPIGVRMTYDVAQAVKVPIIGMGGVETANDALEYILAGADAVGIGTTLFHNPECIYSICEGLSAYMDRHHISSLKELKGMVGK